MAYLDLSWETFDTVILREAIHHLSEDGRLDEALKAIARVCRKEVIVLDPNPHWILRFCRRVVRHKDAELTYDQVVSAFRKNGFHVTHTSWRDVIAFPLSGGFVGVELVPNVGWIKKALLAIDAGLTRRVLALGLQRVFCWRYLIRFERD
jgi:hypothetical protein